MTYYCPSGLQQPATPPWQPAPPEQPEESSGEHVPFFTNPFSGLLYRLHKLTFGLLYSVPNSSSVHPFQRSPLAALGWVVIGLSSLLLTSFVLLSVRKLQRRAYQEVEQVPQLDVAELLRTEPSV